MRYNSGNSSLTDYGFTGQHADATSGLEYYGTRYYDRVPGQFNSADTVLPGAGFDVWGLSRYAYVEGNPVVRIDPTGRCYTTTCYEDVNSADSAGVTAGENQHGGQEITIQSANSAYNYVRTHKPSQKTPRVAGPVAGYHPCGRALCPNAPESPQVDWPTILGAAESGGEQVLESHPTWVLSKLFAALPGAGTVIDIGFNGYNAYQDYSGANASGPTKAVRIVSQTAGDTVVDSFIVPGGIAVGLSIAPESPEISAPLGAVGGSLVASLFEHYVVNPSIRSLLLGRRHTGRQLPRLSQVAQPFALVSGY